MSNIVIIPARFASTRLLGKPLLDIAGQSLIQRVYEQATRCSLIDEVLVATDDDRIATMVLQFGGKVVMTSENHLNGTSRLAEVALSLKKEDLIINVQGDEPFVTANMISAVSALMTNQPKQVIGTLVHDLHESDLDDLSKVKAYIDAHGQAIDFSRHLLKKENLEVLKHIGVYAYHASTLLELSKLKPSAREMELSLEQIRWLDNGYQIFTARVSYEGFGIDTLADLERARAIFQQLK